MFASLGSRIEEVEREEKLRIFFDFFHYGSEEDFHFDASLYDRRGYSFKDAIAPDSFEFRSDYFKVDGRYGRVMYLRDYANFIKDSFMAELTDIDRGLMLSIDASPITTEQAIRQSENKLLAVETNISNWQRKQNQNNNFSATIPYDMERQRNESREFLNDLVARDQRMIPALITIVHTADTKEKLDADTESIRQCARKNLCSLNILRWQQLEGLNVCLGETEVFHLGMLGPVGCFVFLFSASFGQIDGLGDDRNPRMRRFRLIPLIFPTLYIGLYVLDILSPVHLSVKIIHTFLLLLIAATVYYNFKHLIIPDVTYGIFKSMRKYNLLVLCISALFTVRVLFSDYGMDMAENIIVLLLAATFLLLLPITAKGVQKM